MSKKKSKKVNKELKLKNEFEGLLSYFLAVFVCALGVIFPLYIGPRGYENMTLVKNDLFHIITLIMVAAVVAVAIIMTVKGLWKPNNFLNRLKTDWRSAVSVADIAVLAYLLVMTISSLASGNPDIVFWGYEGRNDGLIVNCLYVLIYFLVSRFYDFRPWHLFVIIGASVVVSLVTILHFYGIDWFGITDVTKRHFAIRMLSTIGNINFVSWYTAMMYCLTAASFVLWESKYANWLALPLAVHSIALYYLKVDSGRVAVIAMYILLLYFCIKNRKKLCRYFISLMIYFGFAVTGVSMFTMYFANYKYVSDWRNNLIFTAVAFAAYLAVRFIPFNFSFLKSVSKWKLYLSATGTAVIIALAVLYILPQDTFNGFIYEFSKLLRGEFDDSMGTNRMYIWKRSLNLFVENPILGYGQDVFGKVFMENFREDLIEVYGVPQTIDKAHNIYIQILVCTGILGFVSYMTFLISVVFKAFRTKSPDPFMVALTMAVVSYSVQGFFLFSLPFVTPFFWMFVGMIMSSKFTNSPPIES